MVVNVNGGAGAVTFLDRTTGKTGIVDSGNSLVGSASTDGVGSGGIQNIENNGNPWGIGFSGRADWAEGLDVPVLEEGNEEVEVLFWVGCAGSFDDRNKKISRDMVKIFHAAGVSFGILGTDETCCGDPARRTGNEYLFQLQAQQTIAGAGGD